MAKTTLTQNLGYHLAQRKQRVLLIDMDPQASLTKFMGLIPKELAQTVTESIIMAPSKREKPFGGKLTTPSPSWLVPESGDTSAPNESLLKLADIHLPPQGKRI